MGLLDNLLGRRGIKHDQFRFGQKARGIIAKIECLECHERKTVMSVVSETEWETFLDYSRKIFGMRLGACKTKDGQHDWKTDVLHTRNLAGLCMCEQCWPGSGKDS